MPGEIVDAVQVVLLVDLANVMGSRPDGWWRDRAGAASRLLTALAELPGVIDGPGREPLAVAGIVAVVEGVAKAVDAPGTGRVRVVLAPRDGDSALAAEADRLVAEGAAVLAVTADRGLRARLPEAADVAGPGWLRDQLDGVRSPSA